MGLADIIVLGSGDCTYHGFISFLQIHFDVKKSTNSNKTTDMSNNAKMIREYTNIQFGTI
jgi:hypothetical protein